MRKPIRSLVLAAGLCTPVAALAQPTVEADLGSLVPGTPVVISTGGTAANQVKWWKFTLDNPVRFKDLQFLDIFTLEHTSSTDDPEIGLYDSTGVRIGSDDDDGPSFGSLLTFGTGDGTLPAGGTPTVRNGRDGDLQAGVYYIGISRWSGTPNATGWSWTAGTSAGAATDITLKLDEITESSPASFTDLGDLSGGATATATEALAASEVKWFRMEVMDANNAAGTYVDMDTEGSALAPSNTTRLTLYGPNGALQSSATNTVYTDTVDGSNSLSQLTFGLTSPARPANPGPTAGLAYNGRDGALRGGIYYAAVAGTGDLPSLSAATGANFGHTSASTNTGNVTINVNAFGVSVPPSGTATRTPTFGSVGSFFDVFVTTTPGNNPLSPVSGVSLDAALVDAGTVALHNDGVFPDVSGADNIWSARVTVGAGASLGAQTMTATISDSVVPTPRTSTTNVSFTVLGPAPSCPTADETFAFTNLDSELGAGNAANGVGTFSPTAVDNVVGLRITGRFIPNTSFTAEARIRITFPNLTFIDVQPFTTSGPSGVPVDYTSADIVLPCGGLPTTGTWEVRCWETVTDAAVPDGVWANLCVGLVYGPPSGDPLVWQGDVCVGDAGDLPGTAQAPTGTGPLNSIVGTIGASDIDMYQIDICDYANFSASLVGGTTMDTQLFLFHADGMGAMFNDDAQLTPTIIRQSALNNLGGLLTANGTYYLAVGVYNRDAVDASSQLLWTDTPFDTVRAPNGLGAANPIAGWTGTTSTTGAYTIALTGVSNPGECSGGCPPGCNLADITESGGTLEEPGCPDGQLSLDDILVFIDAFNDATGCPGSAPCNLADITEAGGTLEEPGSPDGQLTLEDILVFVDAYNDASGC